MGLFDMVGWIIRILAWLPGAIFWAEDHFGPGSGAEKRENVMQWLLGKIPSSGWEKADEFARAIGMAIDAIVLMLNVTGVFKKPGV